MTSPDKKQSLLLIIFEKLFVPVVLMATLGLFGSAWTTYLSVRDLIALTQLQGSQIRSLQVEFQEYRTSSITRAELLSTMVRIEQNTELMLLRAGMRPLQSKP